MKCYACGRKSKKGISEVCEYKCDYYFDSPSRTNKRAFGVYIKYMHPSDVGGKDNIMLCGMCYIENRDKIPIPSRFPEEQYIDFLRLRLEKLKSE